MMRRIALSKRVLCIPEAIDMSRKLIVLGGTGFLGKRICEAAVGANFQVVSLSRSGKATSSEPWANEVEWRSCDIFNPDTYAPVLRNATDVVHSLGILLENENYKKQINGSFWSVPKLSFGGFGKNPLAPKKPERSRFTYDMMNRYSATLLADTYMKVNGGQAQTFSYISADRGFPSIPSGYIDSKRQAEEHISQYGKQIRSIILRPGFMFDERNSESDGRTQIRNFLQMLNCGNEMVLRQKIPFVNDLVRPLISTQQVAHSLILALQDPNCEGVLTLDEMLKM
ncbi:ubiquinone biosynthesis protein COQ11 [Kluyveromyces lactis]|uniref:KLLA0A04411p n=1 Tax=Kluyveromyces lactis (strain ATCC 8585 / CBS 2359 / DSM 70799 / NBRC 1267 / NRRL Y-1140 / WM37) TaxID=284590 RepID=Q6CXZ6_KLULA|nr:uncharacterized protein KLLA0_A04411g [Kluyveromyces lactis]CAH02781.1 KLLA0A04411p [Kluyveromyces lactis]|eukprot:XP_451193.1 uncharacterized protein KLLA0_A04411g [Kluyveromyces lactis]